jgi:hypothetical protein
MPIPIQCPHCGHSTTVDDKLVDSAHFCAACGQEIALDETAETAIEDKRQVDPYYVSEESEEDYDAPFPWGASAWAAILFVSAVLSLTFIGSILIALHTANAKEVRIARAKQDFENHLSSECRDNLDRIGHAMHKHEAEYGDIPDAPGPFEGRENSNSNWGWRVRILPFLEERACAEQFRYEEPWNSRHNLEVAQYMPPCYQCPGIDPHFKTVKGLEIPIANYVVITSEENEGDPGQVLIVEAYGRNSLAWTDPSVIQGEGLAQWINLMDQAGAYAFHPGGFKVLVCDDSKTTLFEDVDIEGLREMVARMDE